MTKGSLLSAAQCPKRLYLAHYQPEAAAPPAAGDRLRMETGTQVGKLARDLAGEGHFLPPGDIAQAADVTSTMLKKSGSTMLFEAAFLHDKVGIRTDILKKEKHGLRLVEVKSSSQVKNEHWLDCAVQAWVIQAAGHPLKSVGLTHVNSEFVYERENNYQGLLVTDDLSEQLQVYLDMVPELVSVVDTTLSGPEPQVPTGPHCKQPVACPFQGVCNANLPAYPVQTLPRGRDIAAQFLGQGVEDISQIGPGQLANPIHERIRECVVSGKPFLDKSLPMYLSGLGYPRYFIDFETIQFAIPRWLGTKPYEQHPFQWSCHKEQRDGSLKHFDFLDVSGENPMRDFAETLIRNVGKRGPIFVYSPFEKTTIRKLATRFPDLAQALQAIEQRLVDLLPLVRKNYYHPAMQGSFSIKAVLPPLAPQLSYDDLIEVNDGGAAQAAFVESLEPTTTKRRKAELVARLRAYCERDTLAMVALVEALSSQSTA